MTVEYQTLRNNFYSAKEGALNFKSAKDVYEEIGYDYETLIGQDTRFKNTCAVRMNLALFKSGIFVQGGFEIKKGIFKGKKVETNAYELAKRLKEEWGTPVTFSGNHLPEITGRKGLILFMNIPGYSGSGHIDLIDASSGEECGTECYFNAGEKWFWPLT